MKTLLTITFSLLCLYAKSQTAVRLVYYDSCTQAIENLDFEAFQIGSDSVYNSKNSTVFLPKGKYIFTADKKMGDDNYGLIINVLTIQDSHEISDTITIPKILLVTDNILHSSYSGYYNCQSKCDGHETDYYENGKKRLEGDFINGTPKFIVEYNESGDKDYEAWYKDGIDYKRKDYYYEHGQLSTYQITETKIKSRGVKRTIKLYDGNGHFISREIKQSVKNKKIHNRGHSENP